MKEQVENLLKQGRKLEAVATAHRLGGGSLLQAKRYVDALERQLFPDKTCADGDRICRSWTVKYNGKTPVAITLRDDNGERELEEGSPEWLEIIREITQTMDERHATSTPKSRWWHFSWRAKRKQNPAFGTASSPPSRFMIWLFVGLALALLIGFGFFMNDCRCGYVGLLRQAVFLFFTCLVTFTGYLLAVSKEEKWYYRLWGVLLFVVSAAYCVALGIALVKDVCTDSLKVYEGPVEVKHYSGRRYSYYDIEWQGDDTSWPFDHNLSRSVYNKMVGHSRARVTYWQHTGVVKEVEPM